MQLYNSVTPSAGFDCWELGARGCRDNCERRDVQPYNSATPSAGFDRWEPGASGLGVACIHMKNVERHTKFKMYSIYILEFAGLTFYDQFHFLLRVLRRKY